MLRSTTSRLRLFPFSHAASKRCLFSGVKERTRSPEDEARILIADMSKTKELVYSGPVNSMVRQLQLTMTASSVGLAVGAPLMLHYFTSDWSFGSQLFYTLSVGGAALLNSYLAHRILRRYVVAVNRLIPDTHSLTKSDECLPEDRVEFVTFDYFGRSQKRTFSPSQFESESRGAWTPIGKQQPYLLFHGSGRQTDYFKQLSSKIEQQL